MSVEWVRVGDVLELQRSPIEVDPTESYKRIGIYSWGRGMLYRPEVPGSEMGSLRYFTFPAGALMLSNIQAWEAAVAVTTEAEARYVASNRFLPYVPVTERVDVRYLAHYFVSEVGLAKLRSASPGTQVRNRTLGKKLFEALEIPLPPIDEQRRIADHLNSVEQRLSTSPSRHAPEVERALLSALFGRAAPTRELCELATVSRGVTPVLQPGGPGIVGQASVRWGGVDVTRLKGTDPLWESSRGPERRTRAGDLLLNSTGEGTIGRCGLVDGEAVGLLTDSKVLTVRVGPDMLAEYLTLYLRSPHGQAAIEAVKGANTTKQTELGVQRAMRLPVPVPSTEEQLRVASDWAAAVVPLEQFDRAERHRGELTSSLLPAARNEIFSAMR